MNDAVSDILVINVNMIQAVALAVVMYYLGVWIKSKVQILERYSMPSPVVGGMICAVTLSTLQHFQIMKVNFDGTLQSLLMLAFFTTIGLMASVRVVKQGGKLLLGFFIAVSVLAVIQNVLGMSLATIMGLDPHYGLLAGSVSMMGGLGTSAAFGPYFEETYGIVGGTAVAITSATFGMVAALMIGAPFGEWLIRKYKIKTPKTVGDPEPTLHVPDDMHAGIMGECAAEKPSMTPDMMKAVGSVAICMGLGSIVSSLLGQVITLPAYIGSMIVAAVIRNLSDLEKGKAFRIEDKSLNTVADITLVLFVTMAVNSLKLHELVNLAVPMMVILAAQTVLMLVFAWGVLFSLFKREYDTVMLTVGGIGFSMGATANGLANMQAMAEKYGSSPKAWLIVSLVGAFLIDFVNAVVITTMGAM